MNKYFLPYDVYERHRKVGSFVKEGQTVLDVGGELNHLSQFVKAKKLLVANLNTGDIIIKKETLPFPNSSFDVVCAIDVLEHIPKTNRRQFLQNLMSVAKNSVILSFPISTAKHIEYEKKLQKWLQARNQNVQYLKEHIRYGLPDVDEISSLTENFKKRIFYSGNIYFNRNLFNIFLFDPKIRFVRRAVYILKNFFNLATNSLLYFCLSNKPYSENVNRAYLIIDKNKKR